MANSPCYPSTPACQVRVLSLSFRKKTDSAAGEDVDVDEVKQVGEGDADAGQLLQLLISSSSNRVRFGFSLPNWLRM